MRNDIDYKEYSRLRDIAHKRVQRLEKAGFDTGIQLPTVAQVRASENAYWFFSEIKRFVEEPTTLSQVKKRAAESASPPPIYKPKFPTVKELPKETAEQKKQKRRESKRRSRQRKAVSEIAPSGKGNKFKGYLKAAQSIADQWKRLGEISGNVEYLQNAKMIRDMTPSQAKAFVAYTEYRFSQGDFTSRYSINTFVEDFADMMQSGRNMTNLQKDFEKFLQDQDVLRGHAEDTNSYGISSGQMMSLWKQFVNG